MTECKRFRIILMGPPGAGKGTQAKLIAQTLAIAHIASGDLFRYHLKEGTALGIKAKEYMTQGLLVPDEITITMVLQEVLSQTSPTGFILDGFPRNNVQARTLDESLEAQEALISQAFLLAVPKEELIKRLTGRWTCHDCQAPYHDIASPPKQGWKCDRCGGQLYQRADDKPEAIVKRVEIYQSETEPLAEYYSLQNKLIEVDGVGSVDVIHQRLIASLKTEGS